MPSTVREAKARQFRADLADDGIAEAVVRFLLMLREHYRFTGEYPDISELDPTFPTEAKVPKIMSDYFGVAKDPEWDEIAILRTLIIEEKTKEIELHERVAQLEQEVVEATRVSNTIKLWKRLSAENPEEATIDGKAFLQALIGPYKKPPDIAGVKELELTKDIFFDILGANDEAYALSVEILDMDPATPPFASDINDERLPQFIGAFEPPPPPDVEEKGE
eukprot:GEMP01057521.1.p1 GENE.GEMP01057521.1~~GEMP01057521.1.p1  ORF type:complete len:221 (+),score=61.86 GEMP01057521.1:127-789(+)